MSGTQQGPVPSPSQQLLRYFAYDHLPAHLQAISQPMALLGADMDSQLPDGPEKTTGLRKLLEAKDCFVRAALPPAPADPPMIQTPAPSDQAQTGPVPGERPAEANTFGMTPEELDRVFPKVEIPPYTPVDGRRCECGKVWLHLDQLGIQTNGVNHDRTLCKAG